MPPSGNLMSSVAKTHARLLLTILAQRHPHLETCLMKRPILLVHVQEAGCGIARHVDVGPAIVVEIRGESREPV